MTSQLTAAFNMLRSITGDNMDAYITKHVYTFSTSSAPLCTLNAIGAEMANMVPWCSCLDSIGTALPCISWFSASQVEGHKDTHVHKDIVNIGICYPMHSTQRSLF